MLFNKCSLSVSINMSPKLQNVEQADKNIKINIFLYGGLLQVGKPLGVFNPTSILQSLTMKSHTQPGKFKLALTDTKSDCISSRFICHVKPAQRGAVPDLNRANMQM